MLPLISSYAIHSCKNIFLKTLTRKCIIEKSTFSIKKKIIENLNKANNTQSINL